MQKKVSIISLDLIDRVNKKPWPANDTRIITGRGLEKGWMLSVLLADAAGLMVYVRATYHWIMFSLRMQTVRPLCNECSDRVALSLV